MKPLNSISDFFSRIECPFQIYEMGRLIQPVSASTFLQFEQTQTAWPFPFLRQAWFAILFWVPVKNQYATSAPEPGRHYIWFLKFPLDEQAKLNQPARDDFLRQLFSALQYYLTSRQTDPVKKFQSLETILKDNPYGFTPHQERMANFHACVHQYLNLPASRFYRPAVEYLTGKNGFEQWRFVGYQGLADIAARLAETVNGTVVENSLESSLETSLETIVSQSIQQLPVEPLTGLLNCLENHPLSKSLSEEIIQRLQTELEQENNANTALIAALIRGLARSTETLARRRLLVQLLASEAARDIEIIAALSARCWPVLKDPLVLAPFLEALVNNTQGQNAFNTIVADLLFIPDMREIILEQFRSPERSPLLARAIGAFFNQLD